MSTERSLSKRFYDQHLKIIGDVHFTHRQIDVIACLLSGWHHKRIATHFSIELSTVQSHLDSLAQKLGPGGRNRIITFIERSGKEKEIREYYQKFISNREKLASSPEKENLFEPPPRLILKEKIQNHFTKKVLLLSLLSGAFLLIFIIFNKHTNPQKEGEPLSTSKSTFFRSELPIPHENVRLERPILLEGLETHFQRGSKSIKAIALIGVGGSGKTVIARQYGQSQRGVVWEVNAETKGSLKSSFEGFADHLALTKENKEVLNQIKRISEPNEKEKKIISFVKALLIKSPDWLLIFDNVEQFSDIRPYFPSDVSVCGPGKVIVTTRNIHMHNHDALHHSLLVEELKEEEKVNLFKKILRKNNDKVIFKNKKFLHSFLKQIPSFPLDVSVAAYYLKATNVSYQEYLKDLHEYKKDFDSLQNHILSEVTDYSKTRYNIIMLSVEKVLEKSQHFGGLLLFVSLMNSQNIPKDLLDQFKGSLVVNDFINYTKKYSLVTNNFLPSDTFIPCLNLHEITQKIILSHFLQEKKLERPLLDGIFNVLDNYINRAIEQEDIGKMELIKGHLEKILKKKELFSEFALACLESKLIIIYYHTGDKNIFSVLKKDLKILTLHNPENLPSKNRSRVISSLFHMGKIYIELGRYKEARDCIEKAINIINSQIKLEKPLDLSWSFYHLGNLYRRLGNYQEARDYLEKSVCLNKNHKADNERIVRTLSCLGSVYRGLGLYQKSIDVLEESLIFCSQYYPKDHFRVGRILKTLGNVHRKLGDYKKARHYLEKSLRVYKQYFPRNHMNIGLIMAYLGECLNKLGNYEKARNCLEKSLKIHQEHFETDHPRVGWVMFHLASTYKSLKINKKYFSLINTVLDIYSKENFYYKRVDEDNFETARFLRNIAEIHLDMNHLEKAEEYINRSLKILDHHPHISIYLSFEVLGKIFLKKSQKARHDKEKNYLKNKALEQMNKALQITRDKLPKNSLHLQRIITQIQNIRESKGLNEDLIKNSARK